MRASSVFSIPRTSVALAVVMTLCFPLVAVSQTNAGKHDNGLTMKLTDHEVEEKGYRRVLFDIGERGRLSLYARKDTLPISTSKLETIKTPGRAELAKTFVPEHRDRFEAKVFAFKTGFAAEAPTVSEQLLMEHGFSIDGVSHASLTSANAYGQSSDGEKVGKNARSICHTLQDTVVCVFMQGDTKYRTDFEEQANILAGSLRFENAPAEGFASAQINTLDLPLGDKGAISLQYPTSFSVASNEFEGSLPATLQLQHGDADNPMSVIMIAASAGASPSNTEAMDLVADLLVQNWLKNNKALFANLTLASKGDLQGLKFGDIGRTYAYIMDKLAGGGGKAQIRLSLFASQGVRYSVLMTTHYSPDVDETGPFFVRLGGVTAYDLVMRSLLDHLK